MNIPNIYLFFFNLPAPPAIYTLSLHDALPILLQLHVLLERVETAGDIDHHRMVDDHLRRSQRVDLLGIAAQLLHGLAHGSQVHDARSEEHTSELQSRGHLVCRLLLEKKKNRK